jgi:hypothetical protein
LVTVTSTTRVSVRLPREIRNGCLSGQVSSFASMVRGLIGTEANEGDERAKSKRNG